MGADAFVAVRRKSASLAFDWRTLESVDEQRGGAEAQCRVDAVHPRISDRRGEADTMNR